MKNKTEYTQQREDATIVTEKSVLATKLKNMRKGNTGGGGKKAK